MTRDTYRVDPGADIDIGDVIMTDDGPRRVVDETYYASAEREDARQVTTVSVR